MKPDWKDAPEWAKFVAQDKDGTWYWYEAKPQPGHEGNWTNEPRTKWEQAVAYGAIEARP